MPFDDMNHGEGGGGGAGQDPHKDLQEHIRRAELAMLSIVVHKNICPDCFYAGMALTLLDVVKENSPSGFKKTTALLLIKMSIELSKSADKEESDDK